MGRLTWAAIYGSPASAASGSSSSNFAGGRETCSCKYDYATRCFKNVATPAGSIKLAAYLKRKFGSRQETRRCKRIRNTKRWSLDSENRAVDHYVQGQAGRRIYDHMVALAQDCSRGIQEVIFEHKVWTKSTGTQRFNPSDHFNHVHVGLNRCGAQNFNM